MGKTVCSSKSSQDSRGHLTQRVVINLSEYRTARKKPTLGLHGESPSIDGVPIVPPTPMLVKLQITKSLECFFSHLPDHPKSLQTLFTSRALCGNKSIRRQAGLYALEGLQRRRKVPVDLLQALLCVADGHASLLLQLDAHLFSHLDGQASR
jgi:hypothetical protein